MKVLTCHYFGKNETIYFNIKRLTELELAIGKPIANLCIDGLPSINDVIAIYTVGMQHCDGGRDREFYEEKIQEILENEEVSLQDILMSGMKAIYGSGVFGKQLYYKMFPEEVTPSVETDLAIEETVEKN